MELREINANFEQLRQQAQRLEEIAADIKRLTDRQLEPTIQEMAACWSGETASVYFRKADLVKQDIVKTARFLNEAAESVRVQAKRIYDAETQAVTLTQTNSTNH